MWYYSGPPRILKNSSGRKALSQKANVDFGLSITSILNGSHFIISLEVLVDFTNPQRPGFSLIECSLCLVWTGLRQDLGIGYTSLQVSKESRKVILQFK